MTSTLAKSILPVSPRPEQSSWTHERRNELTWKSRLSMFESFGEESAKTGIEDPLRDNTSSPEWIPVISLPSHDSRAAQRSFPIIDTDRITGITQHRLVSFPGDVLTGFESVAMFGRDVTARTDFQAEENQKAESFVREAVLHILNVYAEDDFEPGFVSPLEQDISDLIDSHGYKALNAIQDELQANQASTSTLAETVRVLGRIRADYTFDARYAVCVHALSHPELMVRDAAGLALCDLADPRAKSALYEAAANENDTLVRTSHLKIARWLESLPAWQSSFEN